MAVRYLRTTHDQRGIPKTFSDEARKAWHETDAGFVGHMLDCERPMTLEEVTKKCQRYYMQEGDCDFLEAAAVRHYLALLIQHGMAAGVSN